MWKVAGRGPELNRPNAIITPQAERERGTVMMLSGEGGEMDWRDEQGKGMRRKTKGRGQIWRDIGMALLQQIGLTLIHH